MRTSIRTASGILHAMDPRVREFRLRPAGRRQEYSETGCAERQQAVVADETTGGRRPPTSYARALGLLSAVVVVALVVVLLGPLYTQLPKRLGMAAPLVTIPTQACVSVSPLPGDVLCIANGAMYGFVIGFCLSWIGLMLAAILEYKLAENGSRSAGLDQRIGRGPEWLRRLPVQHPLYLILVRQIPVWGGHIVTVSAGVMHVPMRRFLWCTAVGALPAALLMPAIGAGIVAIRAV